MNKFGFIFLCLVALFTSCEDSPEDKREKAEFKGAELLGTKYEQLMPFAKVEGKAFEVVADNYVTGVTKNEISAHTGISARNLNRYLGYEEFSGIFIPETEVVSGLNDLESNKEEINSISEKLVSSILNDESLGLDSSEYLVPIIAKNS